MRDGAVCGPGRLRQGRLRLQSEAVACGSRSGDLLPPRNDDEDGRTVRARRKYYFTDRFTAILL